METRSLSLHFSQLLITAGYMLLVALGLGIIGALVFPESLLFLLLSMVVSCFVIGGFCICFLLPLYFIEKKALQKNSLQVYYVRYLPIIVLPIAILALALLIGYFDNPQPGFIYPLFYIVYLYTMGTSGLYFFLQQLKKDQHETTSV